MSRSGTGDRLLLLWIGGLVLARGIALGLNPSHIELWGFDFEAYFLAGQRMAAGDPIYPLADAGHIHWRGVFLYPPVAAVPFAILAGIPFLPASLVFMAVNLLALLVLVRLCASIFRVLGGRAVTRGEWLWAVALLLTSGALDDAIGSGSLSLVLSVCVAAAGLGLLTDRPGRAGAAIAVGALLKTAPGALVPWAAARSSAGRRAAVVALGFGVAVVALSFAVPTLRSAWLDYPRHLSSMADAGPDHQGNMALAGLAEPLLGADATSLGMLVALTAVLVVSVRARHMSVAGGLLAASAASLLLLPTMWRHSFLLLLPGLVAVWAGHPNLRPVLAATVVPATAALAIKAEPIGLAAMLAMIAIGLATSAERPMEAMDEPDAALAGAG